MKRNFLLLLALLLASGCGLHGRRWRDIEKPAVQGRVVSSRGDVPLPGAVVTIVPVELEDDPDAPTCETVSNRNGEFRCPVLRDARWQVVPFKNKENYELRVTLSGYKKVGLSFPYKPDLSPFTVMMVLAIEDGGPVIRNPDLPKTYDQGEPRTLPGS